MGDEHDMNDELDVELADELIARAATSLREPVATSAGFDARVMAEVRGRRSRPWLLRARTLRVSPIAGLAAAAAISAVTLLVPRLTTLVVPPVVSTVVPVVATEAARAAATVLATHAADAAGLQYVQFVFVAPAARKVAVVGSFNDWDTAKTQMVRGPGGVWKAMVPLTAGRYTYSFVVDGARWQADASAPRSVDDDFGAPSSVITVAPRP